jgi:hypothetical protein
MINKLITIVCCLSLISCGLKKAYVQYEAQNDEIIATPNIKKYMKDNPNPSIVLRVPKPTLSAEQEDNNIYLYNAIEKELLLAGFNVKDRGLFSEVMTKSTGMDYAKINELTGTDLILELVKVETKSPFTTNKVYLENGEIDVIKNFDVTNYGTQIEFKLVMVKNNEYGGSYSFVYSPCMEKGQDCNCIVYYKNYNPRRFYKLDPCAENKSKNKVREYIPNDKFEVFIRNGVKKMIEQIRE